MIWQDWVISIGQLVLVGALIPTIKSHEKPPLSTSIITGTIIGIFTLTFLTLELWFSAATASLSSFAWFLISFQKYKQNRQ